MTAPKRQSVEEQRRAERGSWGPDDIEITPPDEAKPEKASPPSR